MHQLSLQIARRENCRTLPSLCRSSSCFLSLASATSTMSSVDELLRVTTPTKQGQMLSPMSPDSPGSHSNHSLLPSPIITRRTRTHSTSERALVNPLEHGKVKRFCRQKGHGFISREEGDDIFVHISDIDGEYVPLPGDEVIFRLCPVPPKMEKFQAVHVKIINFTPEVHLRWDCPSSENPCAESS